MTWLNDIADLLQSGNARAILTLLGGAGTIIGLGLAAGRWTRRVEIHQLRNHVEGLKEQLASAEATAQISERHAALFQQSAELRGEELGKAHAHLGAKSLRASQLELDKQQLLFAGRRIQTERNDLRERLKAEVARAEQLLGDVTGRDGQLEAARLELDRRRKELDRGERRIRRAINLNGFLWLAKALQRVPKFRPQADRRQAIVSVLNLKGGVGKTTVAANFGTALARRGYRVLFVDLDLQGSLTDLLLPLDKIGMLHADKSLAQHFFEAASVDPKTKLADYVQRVCEFPQGGGVDVLGASDNLGYTELSLTLRWLLNRGRSDNRFLLRRALHRRSVANRYDVVIIDCPPLVNISCINALAASDHVIVPVTLDGRAMERVPVLLKRVLRSDKFRKSINCDLKILGVVANRTYRENLTLAEAEAWNLLGTRCRDAAGEDIRRFETTIPISNEARDCLDLLDEAAGSSKAAITFAALAEEIERELPSECRRSRAALS